MKNSVKNMLVIVILGVSGMSASANETIPAVISSLQDTAVQDTMKKEVFFVQNEMVYNKMERTEIPRSIKSAVISKYAAYALEEAYKGSDNSYKLILKNGERKITVFYNEAGEYMKEEMGNMDKVMFLI